MRKVFFVFLTLFILSACSQDGSDDDFDEDEEEILSIKDVQIPEVIFISDKKNSVIDEDEIKSSIKIYLDSSDDLLNASEPFEEMFDDEKEFTIEELEMLDQLNQLTKENDENFANYILNNTLPEGYQKEAIRISRFITTANELLHEINEMFGGVVEDVNEGTLPKVNLKSLISKAGAVTGKEQQKIEAFLDKKNIDTKAFGRDAK